MQIGAFRCLNFFVQIIYVIIHILIILCIGHFFGQASGADSFFCSLVLLSLHRLCLYFHMDDCAGRDCQPDAAVFCNRPVFKGFFFYAFGFLKGIMIFFSTSFASATDAFPKVIWMLPSASMETDSVRSGILCSSVPISSVSTKLSISCAF